MELVKKYNYSQLSEMFLGNTVNFQSDCELIPGFNVTGKVISMKIKGNEILFQVLVNKKQITVGSNMRNLCFNII